MAQTKIRHEQLEDDVYHAGGTDVPVTDGGTGASDASTARTNLGVAIGSDVQAYDAILDDLSGLTQATDKLPYFDSATTAATTDLTAAARTLLDDASVGAMRTTLGVDAAGTDNSTNVTLAGTPNYLTLSGQEITLTKLDITDDTNLIAGTGLTLSTNTLNVDDDYLLNTGDVGTGVYDFGGATSFEIPNGAAPTVDAAGEIAIDTTITDYTGMIKYHDGTEELTVLALPTANLSTTDGDVIKYNAAANELVMAAESGGGGTPGGSDTQVQFNDGGSFGGDADFTWDKTNNVLSWGGWNFDPVSTTSLSINTQSQSITGAANTVIGADAGTHITSETNNTLIGSNAAGNATTNMGSFNIGIGSNALQDGAGDGNTMVGISTGVDMTGDNNVGLGRFAFGVGTGSGDQNIAIGYNAATDAGITGSNNIMIGAFADIATASHEEIIAIGTNALADASNQLFIGANNATGEITDAKIGVNTTDTTGMLRLQSGTGATFFGNYTLPTADGSANQVLQTNGSGTVSFAAVSGGTTTNNYSSIDAPQLFNPDGAGVTANTDDFTLASTNAVALVTHNGQVLDDSEYSLASSTLTVTPDNGFDDTADEVLVFQHSFATSGSGHTLNLVQKSAAYTITTSDYYVECTANTFTLTMPTAVGISGQAFVVKNSGTGTITVDGDGSETIDGSTTIELDTQYQSVTLVSNGSNWIIV